MNIEQLQKYNFVSYQSLCCTEEPQIRRIVPRLFPDHHFFLVENPLRRINFKQKVRMGRLESQIHGLIYNIEKGIEEHDKYLTNFVPFLNLQWIQLYRPVSSYLIEEAIELSKKIDLCILPNREEIVNRKGDLSWFAKPKSKMKEFEGKFSGRISEIMYYNSIRYVTINKLLRIEQERKQNG